MALAVHGTPVQTVDTTGTVSSLAATITTTVPTVVIAIIDTYNFVPSGAIRTVTGVSGGGLTWHKRSSTAGQSGTSFSLNHEVWWANATGSLTAQAITASFSGTVSQNSSIILFAVSGSSTPNLPWDSNGSLPANQSHMVALSSMSQSATLSSTLALVLASVGYAWNAHTASTTPSGFTDVISPHLGTSLNTFVERKASSAPGSVTATWGNNQEFFQITVDALNGDAANNTGTITTTLTKASISAAGTGSVSPTATITTTLTKASISVAGKESFTGTISTARTKASMSAAGWTNVTGTVATNLTKASQSLSGVASAEAGTIITRLSKLSQTVTANEKFIANTVTTTLRAPSQAGAGWTTVRGTMVTALRGVAQLGAGKEIFTGTISTDLPAHTIQIHAVTFELFIGSITTRLSPANIAVVAEEDFIAHVVTRLGSSSGKMTATVIQALEIIQGPIVTALPPFRPLALGAQLGNPGDGKWFSWRYTDA